MKDNDEQSNPSTGSTTRCDVGLITEVRRHLRRLSPSVRKRKTAQLLERTVKAFDAMTEFLSRLDGWVSASDSELRLRMGELSAQELRSARAVLNAIGRISEDSFGS
jgi:hypothetical protein